jgi:hypothetical protein
MIFEVAAEIQIGLLSNTSPYCYRWNGLRSWKSRRARSNARSGPLIRPRTEWTRVAATLHFDGAWLETRLGHRTSGDLLPVSSRQMPVQCSTQAVPSKFFPIYHATLYCRNYWHPRKITYKRIKNKTIVALDAIWLRHPQFSMPTVPLPYSCSGCDLTQTSAILHAHSANSL